MNAVKDIPQGIRAEAAVWVARLHSSGRSAAVEHGVREWLHAHPDHARAFESATKAWEIAGAVPAGALPRVALAARGISTRWTRWSLAAATGAALLGVFLFWNEGKTHYSTAVGEQRTLTLDDGSRVTMNTTTRIAVHYEELKREVDVADGEALFDVAKNPHRPFIVRAGGIQVRALGTQFLVRKDASELTVTLMEGRVQVTQSEGAGAPAFPSPQVLTPGERLTVSDRRKPSLDEPALERVTAWRRGEVVLDKTPLREAVHEMNRYSRVAITVETPAAAELPLSGVFRAGDSEQFAKAVADTYGLTLKVDANRFVLSGSPSH